MYKFKTIEKFNKKQYLLDLKLLMYLTYFILIYISLPTNINSNTQNWNIIF